MKLGSCTVAVALISVLLGESVWADFDVNAVAGTVMIDGSPAPSGTIVNIARIDGVSAAVPVDGPEVPPFLWGRGRFDTGDLPALDTGDSVVIEVRAGGLSARVAVELQAGTTNVELLILGGSGQRAVGEPTGEQSDIGLVRSTPGFLNWAGQVRAGVDRSFRMLETMASEASRLLAFWVGALLAAALAVLGTVLLVNRECLGKFRSSAEREEERR